MRLKKPNISLKNANLFRGRRVILTVSGLLLIAVVCFFCVFFVLKKNDKENTSDRPLKCDQLVSSSQAIMKDEPNKLITPSEARNRYEAVEKSTPGCEKKIEQSSSKLETLTFNYTMAVRSYSFGEQEKAKPYADTALILNEQVQDTEREDGLPDRQLMKEELEAVKNGTY